MKAAFLQFVTTYLAIVSCSAQEPLVNLQTGSLSTPKRVSEGDANSNGIGKVALTWEQPSGTASTFDVYFAPDAQNLSLAKKVTSKASVSSKQQSVILTAQELRDAQKFAGVGNQICFYVVAVAAGVLSEPSTVACIDNNF
jgi:hypothetical protein